MSMKFFTGLQDLLGLYEPGSSAATSSPASPIPPTTSVFPPPTPHSAANAVRKKSSTPTHPEPSTPEPHHSDRIRHCSHNRTVSFPDDESLITGFSEAPISQFHSGNNTPSVDTSEIVTAYRQTCARLHCPPNPVVERQIGYLHKSPEMRQECLSLKGERVSHAQMEALEEVLKRVQFNSLDFEYTFLDDESAISLGEMLEFYDSCVKLNLSFNKQIGLRGWNAIFRAVKNCCSLQVLNLRYTTLSDKALPGLCRTLRAVPCPALSCLHLENTNLAGKNLLILICALKANFGLKELYLGDNGLQGTDGAHLFQLIVSNSSLQLLDLRNNHLGDSGVRHISDALRNRDALENSSLSALVLWNNQVTGASMDCLAEALKENTRIETLNIGNNKLGVEGIAKLKNSLVSNVHLHRLGLQNTGLDCQGAIILAECLADNSAMVRVDVRDNPIALAGLLALHSAMKMNTSITLMNIDSNCVKHTNEKVRQYQDEFVRYYQEIQQYCERNKEAAMARLQVTLDDAAATTSKEDVNTTTENSEEVVAEEEASEDGEVKRERRSSGDGKVADKEEAENSDFESANFSPSIERFASFSCGSTSSQHHKQHQRFARSSSLTCAETVHDIHDRLKEMSGSTHSLDNTMPLDSTSNADSHKTIKKLTTPERPIMGIAEWGSLPVLPAASPTAKPTVRKTRRFSVSPSSSVFDVSTTSVATAPPTTTTLLSPIPVNSSLGSESLSPGSQPHPHLRPSSLAIGIPTAGSVASGPSSAPVVSGSLPASLNIWSPMFKRPATIPERKESNNDMPKLEDEAQIMETVRCVVNDLVNYVVYEETTKVERKASLLLRTTFQPPTRKELGLEDVKERDEDVHENKEAETPVRTPSTPSRVLVIAEELAEESDEMVVSSVVRKLVKDVLVMEKEQLRSTLDRRRKLRSPCTSSTSTPV